MRLLPVYSENWCALAELRYSRGSHRGTPLSGIRWQEGRWCGGIGRPRFGFRGACQRHCSFHAGLLIEPGTSAVGVRRGKAALFQGGANSTRPSLQPEATGAVMEVTKWLKPSVWRVTHWRQRACAGRNASECRASLENDDVQADPTTLSGQADRSG